KRLHRVWRYSYDHTSRARLRIFAADGPSGCSLIPSLGLRIGTMELRFIGSGDAFGSGGRFNTCFLVSGAGCRFLIDCGASSLVALKQAAIDPATVDAVVISHLHG